MPLGRAVFLIAVVASACTSAADVAGMYKQGMRAFKKGDGQGAVEGLQKFVDEACPGPRPDKRCRNAHVTLGQAREKMRQPAAAWVAYDAALAFPPHGQDAEVAADRDRNQRELLDRNGQTGERSPIVLRYRDEVGDEYNPRSVTISVDFEPVLSKEKDASDLHGVEFRKVYGGSVPAGEHVVLVETVHDCKPGGGVPCTRSHARKAWLFRSEARTPTTIEIRAYSEGGGDTPARPALDLTTR